MDLAPLIRDVPDFPKPGIVFKDITPLLTDGPALATAIERMAAPYRDHQVDLVAGTESRGFIFGAAVAVALGVGFALIRKAGKLPYTTAAIEYDLEYGSDRLEMHTDAVAKGQRVLMVDDLLATGGTMKASCDLVRQQGGLIAGIAVLIELTFLNGRQLLTDCGQFHTVIQT
jgi:adenine phosphoribosyltransferase